MRTGVPGFIPKADKHEGETAARAVHARGTNPCGSECALARVAAGDVNAEHDIYDDDAICDYPQSGDLWITEYTIQYQGRLAYTVSIMEFRNGRVVYETQYFGDPFEAPAWRRQWVVRPQ